MGLRDIDVCDDRSPHLHFAPEAMLVFAGPVLVMEGHPVALCLDEVVARRLVELLDQHGLGDVPSVWSPWPSPATPQLQPPHPAGGR